MTHLRRVVWLALALVGSVGTAVALPLVEIEAASPAAVEAFTERNGGSWYAKRSDSGALLWGSGLQLGDPPSTATDVHLVAAAVRARLAENPELHGLTDDELRLTAGSGRRGADASHWFIEFEQQVDGYPIVGARVFARINYGRIVQLGFEGLVRVPSGSAVPAIDRVSALEAVAAQVGPGWSELRPLRLALVADRAQRVIGLQWLVTVRDGAGEGWDLAIDAGLGTVTQRSIVKHTNGVVTGRVHGRTQLDPETLQPFLHQTVRVAAATTTTDLVGYYDSGTDGQVSMTLDALFTPGGFRIRNAGGNNAYEERAGATTVDLEWNDANSTSAERDTFYHLQQTRMMPWSWLPEPWLGSIVPVVVNSSGGTCNAAWNGSELTFYAAGGGCANAGQNADIIAHEWGHALAWNVRGDHDPAAEEGLCDITGWLLTGSPLYAKDFLDVATPPLLGAIDDQTALRDASKLVSVDNIAERCRTSMVCRGAGGYECHCEGLQLSGAAWDLFELLTERWGETEARRLMIRLHFGTFADFRESAEVVDHYLGYDDDDDNLANGTPNGCLITEAFARHGLAGPMALCSTTFPRLELADEQVSDPLGDNDGFADPGETIELVLVVRNAGTDTAIQPRARVASSHPGVSILQAMAVFPSVPPMTSAVARSHPTLVVDPTVSCGSRVIIDVEMSDGESKWQESVVVIVGAPETTLYEASFDRGSDGWTLGLGDAAEGHWIAGSPTVTAQNGDLFQAPGPAAGDGCLFTGANPTWFQRGTGDVDRGTAIAQSPAIDLTGSVSPVLQFEYWFVSAYGRSQTADVFEVEITNGTDSAILFTERVSRSGWRSASVPLAGPIQLTDAVRVRIRATDDDAPIGNIVEAAIDDLRIVEYDCGSNPGCNLGVSLGVLGATSMCLGETATLIATATSCMTPSFQWLQDGLEVPGAIGSTYVIPTTLREGGYRFEVEVSCSTDPACRVTAGPIAVNVASASARVDVTRLETCVGSAAEIGGAASTVAGCPGGPAYQWILDGAPVAGAVDPDFEMPSWVSAGDHRVELVVRCASATRCEDISTPVELIVGNAIAAISERGPLRVCVGAITEVDGSVSVVDNCSGTPEYQWRLDDLPIPGGTGPTLIVPQLAVGEYEISIEVRCPTEAGCQDQSAPVTLIVREAGSPDVIPNSLRLVAAGEVAELTWESSGTGTWNVHRIDIPAGLPTIWMVPAIGWTSTLEYRDDNPGPALSPRYYQVFGADCAGLSVP